MSVLLGPDLVIGLRGDLGKMVVALRVGQVALDVQAFRVLEIDDGVGYGRFGAVDHDAVHGVTDGRFGLSLEGQKEEAGRAETARKQPEGRAIAVPW